MTFQELLPITPGAQQPKQARRRLGRKRYWFALLTVLAIAGGIKWLHAYEHREWQREASARASFQNSRLTFVKRQMLPAWFFGEDGERFVEIIYNAGRGFVPGAAVLPRDTVWVGNELSGRAMHSVDVEPPLGEFERAKKEFPHLERIKTENDWHVGLGAAAGQTIWTKR